MNITNADPANADFAVRDQIAPTVVSSNVYFDTTPRIVIVFSEDVGSSLTASDFAVFNIDLSTTHSDGNLSLDYDAATKTAILYLGKRVNGVWTGLPTDGDYVITFDQSPSDLSGNAVTDYSQSTFVLRGDVNRDRKVDFDDLLVIAQHYGMSGNYAYGNVDFDQDGAVDFDDLLELGQNYGASLVEGIVVGNFGDDWARARDLV